LVFEPGADVAACACGELHLKTALSTNGESRPEVIASHALLISLTPILKLNGLDRSNHIGCR
jgi:hypothetical protein